MQISFAVTAKLISAFVFATWIEQSLFFLNPKFQACYHLLCLCRPVYVRPVRKPHCWFSHEVAQFYKLTCTLTGTAMLSWASYLFGSGTSEPQSEETSQEPKASEEPETMETSDSPAKPEPEQDWVVVDYAGVYFTYL